MKSAAAVTLGLASAVLAASRTSAPEGCLTVSTTTGSGNYTSIQDAVDALSTTSTSEQCIFIESGTYEEQVLVSARSASRFTIYGWTEDDTSYTGNTVTIVEGLSQDDGLTDDETGTLRVKADGFRIYNVDVENSRGEGSQAIALSAYSDSGIYGCSLTGFQDTLLAQEGTQLYAATRIVGATDFIFGQHAAAWFSGCDLRVVEADVGYVTAHGPTEAGTGSAYVFDGCDVAAAEGDDVSSGAYYLGRPWREYAHVVFQDTSMSDVINSAGWSIWNEGDERTGNVLFGEYNNTGAGSEGPRADFATALNSSVAIGDILGDYEGAEWFDAGFLAGEGATVA